MKVTNWGKIYSIALLKWECIRALKCMELILAMEGKEGTWKRDERNEPCEVIAPPSLFSRLLLQLMRYR